MDPAACKHARTQLVAKDNDAEYIECLDCGAILEKEELARPSEAAEASGFNETLGDA